MQKEDDNAPREATDNNLIDGARLSFHNLLESIVAKREQTGYEWEASQATMSSLELERLTVLLFLCRNYHPIG